jgi:hypothetical protein
MLARTRRCRRRMAAIAALTVALLALAAIAAYGERAQKGNLVASLNSDLSPLKLPRHRLAPVTVTLSGSVSTADGSPLPRVTQVELDLAGSNLFFTRGLPTCTETKLRNVNNALALTRCGAALVGQGRLDGQVFVEFQKPFVIHARLFAFNGQVGGHPAILVHAFAPTPPVSFILPFVIHHRSGAFGTMLVAKMPGSVGASPHAADFELTVGRHFRYRDATRSYISASCPVPTGFTAGFLSFARATYTFEGGKQLRVASVRTCRSR